MSGTDQYPPSPPPRRSSAAASLDTAETTGKSLLKLLRLSYNRICADCRAPLAESHSIWASLSAGGRLEHGVFICQQCCVAHRHLSGVCMVKSVHQSLWTRTEVLQLGNWGNFKTNAVFERYGRFGSSMVGSPFKAGGGGEEASVTPKEAKSFNIRRGAIIKDMMSVGSHGPSVRRGEEGGEGKGGGQVDSYEDDSVFTLSDDDDDRGRDGGVRGAGEDDDENDDEDDGSVFSDIEVSVTSGGAVVVEGSGIEEALKGNIRDVGRRVE